MMARTSGGENENRRGYANKSAKARFSDRNDTSESGEAEQGAGAKG